MPVPIFLKEAVPRDAATMETILGLSDKDFDGQLQLEEFITNLKYAEEAMTQRRKQQQEWVMLQPPMTRRDIRVFCVPTFVEACLKIGLNFLNFHATDAQSRLPTSMKVLWLISFISSRFEKNVLKRPEMIGEFYAKHPKLRQGVLKRPTR